MHELIPKVSPSAAECRRFSAQFRRKMPNTSIANTTIPIRRKALPSTNLNISMLFFLLYHSFGENSQIYLGDYYHGKEAYAGID